MTKRKFTDEEKTIYYLGYLNGKNDALVRMRRTNKTIINENTQLRESHNKLVEAIKNINDKEEIAKLKRIIENFASVLKVLDEHEIK